MQDLKVSTHLVGGKILSASDLEAINQAEVKNRKYTHCTLDCGENGEFLAQVEYSETSKSWEPSNVWVGGEWIGMDEFCSTEAGESFSCENYRSRI